jgi:hypothetical protein
MVTIAITVTIVVERLAKRRQRWRYYLLCRTIDGGAGPRQRHHEGSPQIVTTHGIEKAG